jgi:hypothetical protein
MDVAALTFSFSLSLDRSWFQCGLGTNVLSALEFASSAECHIQLVIAIRATVTPGWALVTTEQAAVML